jgi:hypothetical protein
MQTAITALKKITSTRWNLTLWLVLVLFVFHKQPAQAEILGSGSFVINNGPVYSAKGQYIGRTHFTLTVSPGKPTGEFTYSSGSLAVSQSSLIQFGSGAYITLGSTGNSLYQYTLTTSAINGTITRSPDQPTYNYDTLVNLTATPDVGYLFVDWTQNGYQYSTSRDISVNMTRDYNLVANFSAITRIIELSDSKLTWERQAVSSATNQSYMIHNVGNSPLNVSQIICPSGFSCDWTGQILPGESQTVNATFSPTVSGTYSGNLQILSDATEGNSLIAVTAEALNTYNLSAFSLFGTVRTKMETKTYWEGSVVTMKATPVLNYAFMSWTENGRIISRSSHLKTTVKRARRLRANYQPMTNNQNLFPFELK